MNPIYPDKSKTGLAALKPLTDVFFAEPERWEWQEDVPGELDEWRTVSWLHALGSAQNDIVKVRLTPKPRRVWIGDESYPEPLDRGNIRQHQVVFFANVPSNGIRELFPDTVGEHYLDNGFIFGDRESAQQCLDAHRRARRVE